MSLFPRPVESVGYSSSRCGRDADERVRESGHRKITPGRHLLRWRGGVPIVALREDVERKALGAVSAVRFLGDFEDQFGHRFIIALRSSIEGHFTDPVEAAIH